MKALLLAVFSLMLVTTACKKNKNANQLVGTWKLTATQRIGMTDWENVHPTGEMTLTFKNDYTYTQVPPLISSFSGCNGSYRIESGNLLFMTTSCSLNPAFEEQLRFTRDGNTLILDHIMTATGVREKYIKQ